jgi:hypothetical protein
MTLVPVTQVHRRSPPPSTSSMEFTGMLQGFLKGDK